MLGYTMGIEKRWRREALPLQKKRRNENSTTTAKTHSLVGDSATTAREPVGQKRLMLRCSTIPRPQMTLHGFFVYDFAYVCACDGRR